VLLFLTGPLKCAILLAKNRLTLTSVSCNSGQHAELIANDLPDMTYGAVDRDESARLNVGLPWEIDTSVMASSPLCDPISPQNSDDGNRPEDWDDPNFPDMLW